MERRPSTRRKIVRPRLVEHGRHQYRILAPWIAAFIAGQDFPLTPMTRRCPRGYVKSRGQNTNKCQLSNSRLANVFRQRVLSDLSKQVGAELYNLEEYLYRREAANVMFEKHRERLEAFFNAVAVMNTDERNLYFPNLPSSLDAYIATHKPTWDNHIRQQTKRLIHRYFAESPTGPAAAPVPAAPVPPAPAAAPVPHPPAAAPVPPQADAADAIPVADTQRELQQQLIDDSATNLTDSKLMQILNDDYHYNG